MDLWTSLLPVGCILPSREEAKSIPPLWVWAVLSCPDGLNHFRPRLHVARQPCSVPLGPAVTVKGRAAPSHSGHSSPCRHRVEQNCAQSPVQITGSWGIINCSHYHCSGFQPLLRCRVVWYAARRTEAWPHRGPAVSQNRRQQYLEPSLTHILKMLIRKRNDRNRNFNIFHKLDQKCLTTLFLTRYINSCTT